MKPPPPLESEIQRAILDYLAIRKILHWRNNTTGRVIQRAGKSVYIPTAGRVGASDIMGLLSGIFFALEVKRPGAKPTPEQVKFLAEVEANGGIGKVVYSVEDVKHALGGA